MGRGIANTFPVTLSSVIGAFTTGGVSRTDTYDTGSGSSTAPADAVWAEVEVWGGGGGARGYNSSGSEYGGGGGAYFKIELPVIGGSTSISYAVGAAGVGGPSGSAPAANGTAGGQSNVTLPQFDKLVASGGRGGASTIGSGWSVGGSNPSQAGIQVIRTVSTVGGNANTTHGGTSPNGGSGGATSGAAGSAPGGGGAPGKTAGVAGGNGAAGRVKITWWYKSGVVDNLRSFLREGSYVTNKGAVGYNGIIPSSGTIKLSDFRGVDGIGMNANNLLTGTSNVYIYNSDEGFTFIQQPETGFAAANAVMRISANGWITNGYDSNPLYAYERSWMERLLTNTDSTLSSNFDVLFNKKVGTTPSGNSVNTWIQCSTEPVWWFYTEQSGAGSDYLSCNGFLAFRRRSDNTELINVACNLTSTSTVYYESGQ